MEVRNSPIAFGDLKPVVIDLDCRVRTIGGSSGGDWLPAEPAE